MIIHCLSLNYVIRSIARPRYKARKSGPINIWEFEIGLFHCTRCGRHGNTTSLSSYNCKSQKTSGNGSHQCFSLFSFFVRWPDLSLSLQPIYMASEIMTSPECFSEIQRKDFVIAYMHMLKNPKICWMTFVRLTMVTIVILMSNGILGSYFQQ